MSLPTDVSSEDAGEAEDAGEDIFSIKRQVKMAENRRRAITLDEVTFAFDKGQSGKFPYGSRCYR